MGSNPLAQASGTYHLGPDLGIFGVEMTPNVGQINFNNLFIGSGNPFKIQFTHQDLTVVSGHRGDAQNPFDMRIRIGGVSYLVPYAIAKNIKGKNGGRVYWRSTRWPGESDSEGSFRFFRNAPGVR